MNMWESFKGQLVKVQDQHVPVRRSDKDNKVREPWMIKEVVILIRKKKVYVTFKKVASESGTRNIK